MQRLYSMFPRGGPGIALLLLRVALGILLLRGVLGPLASLEAPWLLAAPWLVAAALGLGLLTPVFAVLTVLIEALAWLGTRATPDVIHACAVFDSVLLMLLGPGGYSLDARLFGRRRIVFPRPGGPG